MKKHTLFEKKGINRIIFSEEFPLRVIESYLPRGPTNESPHKHPQDIECYFVLAGEIILEVEGKKYPLKKGELSVVLQGENHRIVEVKKTTKIIVVRSRKGKIERIPPKV